jgi:parallel beta-helix repeat protein
MKGIVIFLLSLFISNALALDRTIGTQADVGVDKVCTQVFNSGVLEYEVATCIQGVIDEVAAAGGGTVFFKTGDYRMLTGLYLKSNVKLDGEYSCNDVYPQVHFVREGDVFTHPNEGQANPAPPGFVYAQNVNNVDIRGIHIVTRWAYGDECIDDFPEFGCIGLMKGLFVKNVDTMKVFNMLIEGFYRGLYVEKSKNIKVNLNSFISNTGAGTEVKTSSQVELGYEDTETTNMLTCKGLDSTILNWFRFNKGLGGVYMGQVEDIQVYKVESRDHNWDGFGFKNVKNIVMTQSFALDNGRHGIDVFGYSFTDANGDNVQAYSNSSAIKFNSVSGNNNGIMMQYVNDINIMNNKIYQNKAKGIMISTECKNVLITNNEIRDNAAMPFNLNQCGISIGKLAPDDYKTNSITVTNNILDVHRKSVCVRNSKNVLVNNNVITNGDYCVQVSGTNIDSEVQNNRCSNIKGIILEDTVSNTLVKNNIVQVVTPNKCVQDKTLLKQNTLVSNPCVVV